MKNSAGKKVIESELEGRFLLANKVVADGVGCSVDEIEGKLEAELHSSQEEVERMHHDDLKVIESGEVLNIAEEPFTDSKGLTRYLQTIKAPCPIEAFGEPAVIGVAIDITKMKKTEAELRRSEENLRTTLNSIGDAVIATDKNGLITQMNPIAEKLTGWTVDDALSRPLK